MATILPTTCEHRDSFGSCTSTSSFRANSGLNDDSALRADHAAGMRPGFPTPASMVADNKLALGKKFNAISHRRFWDSTAIFVTKDDSQDSWEHIPAYINPGYVISPNS